MISDRRAVFGTPEILAVNGDSRFTGGIFQHFRTARSLVSHTVIPAHHQSLGATERRHRLFRAIIDHAIGNRKTENLSTKEWEEFAEMATMRLNSKVPQYDGFTQRRRVSGRTPKLLIGEIGNPFSKILRTQRKRPMLKLMDCSS